MNKEQTMPPLGANPKWVWLELRLKDLNRAIAQYTDAGFSVPKEWIEERDELLEKCK